MQVDAQVRAELQRIAASPHFARAHRCTALLTYLVDHYLSSGRASVSEYAIGVELFRRDASSYHTADDPIVRVLVGRLRLRLAAYYADQGRDSALCLSMPLGGYELRADSVNVARRRRVAELKFTHLVCLSPGKQAHAFTSGLSEELSYCLYQTPVSSASLCREQAYVPESYLVAGTVRWDGHQIRVTLRLKNAHLRAIAWSGQLDHFGDLSIASQQILAERCVQILLHQIA